NNIKPIRPRCLGLFGYDCWQQKYRRPMAKRPRKNSTYFVYLLRCRGGALYCGMTNDLAHRVERHNAGKGGRFTRSRLPVELAWRSRRLASRSLALRLEAAIKGLSRA